MREIKFRAWSTDNKEMYYPNGNYEFIVNNINIGFVPKYDKEDFFVFNTEKSLHEKEIIVMQYTGLKDKNGVEIYEGDIVKGKELFKVIYQGVSFQYKPVTNTQYKQYTVDPIGCEVEVIGNIHENPELLK